MSNRQRNHKRNKYVIRNWWRGDIEDEKYWQFPTQEAAWAHVVGQVRRRVKSFEPEETTMNHGPTQIDWEKFKAELFGKRGYAEVVYCQCPAWNDNWEFFKREG